MKQELHPCYDIILGCLEWSKFLFIVGGMNSRFHTYSVAGPDNFLRIRIDLCRSA